MWANPEARAALDSLVAENNIVQYSAVLDATFKKGGSIEARFNRTTPASEQVKIIIQLTDSPFLNASKQQIEALANKIEAPWQNVMKFHSTRIIVDFSDIQEILDMPDSFWVGEYFERTLNDEVQNQILVGDLTPDNTQPAMTGYADFLSSRGFPTTPAFYPIVDVTDDGIGNGTTTSNDPTFHEGGLLANPSRLAYISNCTSAATGEGIGGHGHLNLNIVGGFESRVGFPFIDPNGFIRTQGANPFTRLAGTRIFAPGFNLDGCGGNDVGLINSVQDDGAQIMNNSWGCGGCAGSYDDSSQAFDMGTRDADLTEAGNQELIMLFAAGNSGPGAGTVGTPGNGKNMITVGASENFRPTDENGPWTDGCGTGPAGADNAMDVIGFSSRGPSPGGRTKPEIIAPGTHVHGTASTHPAYDGSSVCDQFAPSSQMFIASSTGTSHSAPAAAGVASLIYYWLESAQGNTLPGAGVTPSPALMKAYLMAHPTYLTGVSANDNLPSNSQGFGMPNLDLMFDDTQKFVHNQSQILNNSGEDWTWVGSAADPTKPVRISLAYTDQPGAVGTSPQVNNLDLEVSTNGDTFLGNNFLNNFSITGGIADALNNYEAVFLPAGIAADLTITVIATNIAGDGVPNTGDATDQDFAIVCYNCAQSPTFTINSTPSDIEVCSPSDAVYNLDINSILGFTDPVTLSVSSAPANSTVGFSQNPVTPTGSSVLTIGNIVATTPGSYSMSVDGVAGAENKSRAISLSIFDQIPANTTLTLPADNASNVSGNGIPFSWSAIAEATSYTFELSDIVDFSNIIETTVVSTANYTSLLTLNPNTEYFWRVKTANVCGEAMVAVEFSFTTANEICFTGSQSIPDNDSLGTTVQLNLIDNAILNTLLVKVDVNHTFPGDLIFTLTHVNSNTQAILMDRPGVPDSLFGCGQDDVMVTFDDNSATPVEDVCEATSPGITDILAPEQALSAFDNINSIGSWELNVSDNAGIDTGSITRFCLIPDQTLLPDVIFLDGFEP